jgi:ABC-type multidrug transport system fused ATPase/permease subunit
LFNSADRVKSILDLPRDDYSNAEEVERFGQEHAGKGIGVEARNVSFAYEGAENVFSNAEFNANPHETVAFVGPSGEGKTTMLRLLLAIIRPGEGQVRITTGDGELEDSLYATAATRSLFAYVPQGNTMFSGTIAQNMRNVKKDATDDEIIKALKMACAWDFVKKLPEGINSEMGEHGSGFSEGQAQRLSIARAILRQSPILLLDEATSALDVWTEKEVLKNIMADEYPRTTIITTHRPSVLKQCDRVYAIRNGNCCKLSDEEISEMESIA